MDRNIEKRVGKQLSLFYNKFHGTPGGSPRNPRVPRNPG